ncbi:MAG: hypothetical protein K5931_00975 [Lachnospiraceae bacterium]|nr:hypothetical protein [Lachnospiraceae bacterium]
MEKSKVINNSKEKVTTLWILGDSTVSAFSDNYYMPRYGWGTKLCLFFKDNVEFNNLAISGTSSKSFRSSENYKCFIEGVSQGDYVIIGFGHNDEKTGALTFTSPLGDLNTPGSFAHSLYSYYIKPAEEAGAHSILVTPIARRDESGKYEGSFVHITKDGDYAKAVKDLGKTLSIPVCDLTRETADLAKKVDFDKDPDNDTLFQHARTGSNMLSVDDTHTSLFGAVVNAYLIAKDIASSPSPLKNFLKEKLENPLENPGYWKDLSINKDYVDPVYIRPSKGSDHWPSLRDEKGNVWYASVFGDVDKAGIKNTKEAFLGVNEDKDMTISMGISRINGKIMDKSDGIAMYFTRLLANDSFSLSADIKIESFNFSGSPADYSAFGLMVRDDMYIDEYNGLILGDYVSAGITFRPGYERGSNTFARKSGLLDFEGGQLKDPPKEGDVIRMKIASTGDGYSGWIEGYDEVISGYDYTLTAVDNQYIYVGFFASRSVTISVKNIELVINGEIAKDYDIKW